MISSTKQSRIADVFGLWTLFFLTVLVPLAFYKQIYNTYWITKNLVFLILNLILVLAFLIYLWRRRNPNLRCLCNPIVYSTVAFQFCLVLATVLSSNRFISFYGSYWRQMGLVVMFPLITLTFIGVCLFRNSRRIHSFVGVVTWFCLFYSLLGILQKILKWYDVKILGVNILYGRASGFQGNPDFYAPMLLLLVFPVLSGVAVNLARKKWIWSGVYALIFFTGIGAIISTVTRGAWIGLIFGLGFWVLVGYVFFWRKHWKYLLGAGFGVFLVSVIIFIMLAKHAKPVASHRENAYDKLKSIVSLQNKTGLVNQRLVLWRDTLDFSYENLKKGKIFGCGWENFIRPFMKHKSLKLAQISKSINYDNPHNHYLGILAKAGIPTLLAYLCLLVSMYWHGIRFMKRKKRLTDRLIVLAVLSAITAYGINLLSIFPTISTTVVFFIYVALISRLCCPARCFRKTETDRLEGNTGRVAPAFIWSISVVTLVITIVGLANYFELIRADYYFERGRRTIQRKPYTMEMIESALADLKKANELYPQEAFYVHEMLRAMGLKASRLSKMGRDRDANALFDEMLAITKRYDKTSWTPDILYLTMAINAYYLGYMDAAIALFNKALEWDRWCFKAHTSLGIFYHLRYQVIKEPQDLQEAFDHSFTTSTLVLKYAPYWDKNAMHNTLRYGQELYGLTKDPAVLDRLMETMDVYVRYLDDPDPVKHMANFFKGTKYEKTMWSALIFFEIHDLLRKKTLSLDTRRKRLQELKKELKSQNLEDPFFRGFVRDAEEMKL